MEDKRLRDLTEAKRRELLAIEHFCKIWGGKLPAPSSDVCRDLQRYSLEIEAKVLRAHLKIISRWHTEHNFFDPTIVDNVGNTLRFIVKEQHAYPVTNTRFSLQHLLTMCDALAAEKNSALESGNVDQILRAHRNLALLLIGFWRGFRAHQLSQMRVENVSADPERGMSICIPPSKWDDGHYVIPALRAYCPTAAYLDWLKVSKITSGPIFRPIMYHRVTCNKLKLPDYKNILNELAAEILADNPDLAIYLTYDYFTDWDATETNDFNALVELVGCRSEISIKAYIPRKVYFESVALFPELQRSRH